VQQVEQRSAQRVATRHRTGRRSAGPWTRARRDACLDAGWRSASCPSACPGWRRLSSWSAWPHAGGGQR